ncbi:MAG: retron Eco8 family effector endonuclease [Hespellia sp.]|nr:retron Eco8 family effector endonuclease [Hespellia sp.]
MAIKYIEIEGFRSIRNERWTMNDVVLLIGKNGSGKSNILDALDYFYKNMIFEQEDDSIFDRNNRFNNEVRIQIVYDMKRVGRIVNANLQDSNAVYNGFYRKIRAMSEDNKVVLELRKRKNKPVVWNADYNIRQILNAVFPLYFVDARQIQLTDWENLWGLIGDFTKLENSNTDNVKSDLWEYFLTQNDELGSKIKNLKKALEDKKIALKDMSAKEFARTITAIALDGTDFQYNQKSLDGYSDGTNAYNYTTVLIEILCLIHRTKLKEPVIILDEPELSLHHTMIDQLMNRIIESSDQLQYMISTHSARAVKNLLEQGEAIYDIYHISYVKEYSHIQHVNGFQQDDRREQIVITDSHANSFFAKMVVSVEGESEQEVLQNKYLRCLFPTLTEIDIVKGMSNQVVNNIISPVKRNYNVPWMSIVDMDKVLTKKENENSFVFRTIHSQQKKEAYLYGKERMERLGLHKRIRAMAEKCRFSYQYPFFSCEDSNYAIMKKLIRQYYWKYQTIVLNTTIEGSREK